MIFLNKSNITSLFSVLVYTLKSNYLLFTYLLVPFLMRGYKNTSYLSPILSFAIIVLLVLLLPKSIGEIDYNKIINKSFVAKISYYLSQGISAIVNMIIVAYTVGRIFFYDYSMLIFISITVLATIYIATNSIEVVFNSSTFLLIVAILAIIFPLFLTNDVKDYSLLKPFNLEFNYSFLLLLYFGLDAISIVISGVKLKTKITKGKLLIPIAIIFFFMVLELLNIILVTGFTFLIDNEFLGFFSLFIQDTINYVGALGFLFLYVIPVVGCYRAGYGLRKIKDAFNIKSKWYINLIVGTLLFIGLYFIITYLDIFIFSLYSTIVATILLGVVYVFIIINRSTKYEIRF